MNRAQFHIILSSLVVPDQINPESKRIPKTLAECRRFRASGGPSLDSEEVITRNSFALTRDFDEIDPETHRQLHEPGPSRTPQQTLIHQVSLSALPTEETTQHEQYRKKPPQQIPICEICKKVFKWKYSLVRHLKVAHGNMPSVTCTECGKSFKMKSNLKLHLLTHSSEKSFLCKRCGKSFKCRRYLTHHMKSHSKGRSFVCELCGKNYKEKSSLDRHLRVHAGERPFSCGLCGKRFTDKIVMTRHMLSHTDEKSFACHHCKKNFKFPQSLEAHHKIHAENRLFSCLICTRISDNEINSIKSMSSQISSQSEPNLSLIPANKCNSISQPAPTKSNKIDELALVESQNSQDELDQCTTTPESPQLAGMLTEIQLNIPDEFFFIEFGHSQDLCHQESDTVAQQEPLHKIPNSEFNDKSLSQGISEPIEAVTEVVTEETEYESRSERRSTRQTRTLEECRRLRSSDRSSLGPEQAITVASDGHLEIHERHNFVAESPAHPDEAGPSWYPQETSRDETVSSELTSDGPNKQERLTKTSSSRTILCNICQRCFNSQSGLKRHMAVHKNERRFHCKVCGRSFNDRSNLNTHKLTHSNERPFQCKICKSSFKAKRYLKKHAIMHGPKNDGFECKKHVEESKHRVNFDAHWRIHNGKKTLSCELCGRRFTVKRVWKNHMEAHANDKTHACLHCSRHFKYRQGVELHHEIHNDEKLLSCKLCTKPPKTRVNFDKFKKSRTSSRSKQKNYPATKKQQTLLEKSKTSKMKKKNKPLHAEVEHSHMDVDQRVDQLTDNYLHSFDEYFYNGISDNDIGLDQSFLIAEHQPLDASMEPELKQTDYETVCEIDTGGTDFDSLPDPNSFNHVMRIVLEADGECSHDEFDEIQERIDETIEKVSGTNSGTLESANEDRSGDIFKNFEKTSTESELLRLLKEDPFILNMKSQIGCNDIRQMPRYTVQESFSEPNQQIYEAGPSYAPPPSDQGPVFRSLSLQEPRRNKKRKKCSAQRASFCNVCKQIFKSKYNLNRHQRRFHGVREKFPCKVCGKIFKDKSNLELHIKTHDKEKPYSCKYCEKCFKTKAYMKEHILIHLNKKPYRCQICGKGYGYKQGLSRHISAHRNERPLSCELCGERFATRATLKKHMMSHSVDKPFSCEHCEKSFKYKYNLLYHKNSLHMNEISPEDSENEVHSIEATETGPFYQILHPAAIQQQESFNQPTETVIETVDATSDLNEVQEDSRGMFEDIIEVDAQATACESISDPETTNQLTRLLLDHADTSLCDELDSMRQEINRAIVQTRETINHQIPVEIDKQRQEEDVSSRSEITGFEDEIEQLYQEIVMQDCDGEEVVID
ncbi:hypothetical protein QAD02_009705 [Eretmocerus hayati]|uniref:Uncharacterized protein n=1 Tax=Eretmocerus hayati TaxID=131215 RepID=A0ACC2NA49_9HYME|nr:hypothetical protein QAD02_009705 [Eretmocerus hayati]